MRFQIREATPAGFAVRVVFGAAFFVILRVIRPVVVVPAEKINHNVMRISETLKTKKAEGEILGRVGCNSPHHSRNVGRHGEVGRFSQGIGSRE